MELIPTVKIVNRDGIKAVKNGQKANEFSHIPNTRKPDWIRVKATFDPRYNKVKEQAHKNLCSLFFQWFPLCSTPTEKLVQRRRRRRSKKKKEKLR